MLKRIVSFIVRCGRWIFRNPKLWAVIILLPVFQVVFLMQVEKHQSPKLTAAVLNNDHSNGGAELIRRLENAGVFAGVTQFRRYSEVKTILEQKQAAVILVVPEDFTRNILSSKPSRIQMILDGRQTAAAMMSRGYVLWVAQRFAAQVGGLNQRDDLVTVVLRYWYEEELTFKWYALPGILCLLSLLTAFVSALLFVPQNAHAGVLKMILHGVLPALLFAAFQTGIMFLAVIAVFQLPQQGNMMSLYWTMAAFSLAVIGLVFAVCGIFKGRLSRLTALAAILLSGLLLSGMVMQLSNKPRLIQYTAGVNPLRWLLAAAKGVLINDMNSQAVFSNTWPLLIIAAIALAVAVWFSRSAANKACFQTAKSDTH